MTDGPRPKSNSCIAGRAIILNELMNTSLGNDKVLRIVSWLRLMALFTAVRFAADKAVT